MKRMMQIATCTIVALLIAGTAYGVEPAYRGPFGNPEEPALRPYKWLWRGIKATAYHTVSALRAGNEDYPLFGTVYAAQGFRVGLTEFNRSLWRGMSGSLHIHTDYRETGKVHEFIEQDMLLRNVADAVTAMYVTGLLRGSASLRPEFITQSHQALSVNRTAFENAVVIYGGQKGLDRTTPVHQWKPVKEWEETNPVRRAQERYIGQRANVNNMRAEGRGNFLRNR